MADDVDMTGPREQQLVDAAIENIRQKAEIKPGDPGDCDFCGEWAGRLIGGACASCRDRYKLP